MIESSRKSAGDNQFSLQNSRILGTNSVNLKAQYMAEQVNTKLSHFSRMELSRAAARVGHHNSNLPMIDIQTVSPILNNSVSPTNSVRRSNESQYKKRFTLQVSENQNKL